MYFLLLIGHLNLTSSDEYDDEYPTGYSRKNIAKAESMMLKDIILKCEAKNIILRGNISSEEIENVKNFSDFGLSDEFLDDNQKFNEFKNYLSKIYLKTANIDFSIKNYLAVIENGCQLNSILKSKEAETLFCLSNFKAGNLYKGLEAQKRYEIDDKQIKEIIEKIEDKKTAINFKTTNFDDKNNIKENVINNIYVLEIISIFLNMELVDQNKILFILEVGYHLLSNLDNINFVDTEKDVIVFGDTHGQFFDTFNALKNIKGNDFDFDHGFKIDTDTIFIFNGDFVDRGLFSIENYTFLLMLKILYPENIHLNRGNHEISEINLIYGFKGEIERKYGLPSTFKKSSSNIGFKNDVELTKLYEAFNLTFSMLPIATIIHRKIFVVHGGLPEISCSVEDILALDRKNYIMGKNKIIDCLLWSDPRDNIIHKLSDRGLGIFWTDTITKIFLKENNLELIVRSHEKCTIGRSFIFDKKVITVFSAPNYMNSKNLAAYLVIQKDFIKTGQEICDEKTRIIDAKDSMNCNGFSYYFETFEEWSFDYVENLKGFSLTR